jgi:hypothetical protein
MQTQGLIFNFISGRQLATNSKNFGRQPEILVAIYLFFKLGINTIRAHYANLSKQCNVIPLFSLVMSNQ